LLGNRLGATGKPEALRRFHFSLQFHDFYEGLRKRSMSVATVAPKRRSRRNSRDSRSIYYWYTLPGAIAFVAVVAYPLFRNIQISFTKWNGYGVAKNVGWRNYAKLMHDSSFWVSFLHAFEFMIAMSIIPTVLGLIFGALIFDFISPYFPKSWTTFFRMGLFMPQIVPITVTSVLWTWLLSPNEGVINNVLKSFGMKNPPDWLGSDHAAILAISAVCIWIQIGYTITIFITGMGRIDPSLNEAADLDGANWWQRFRAITVTQLAPEISIVLLTTTVAAIKIFAPVQIMTGGGPGNSTYVPSFYSYFNFFTTQRVGYGAAIATVMVLLLSVLSIFLFKFQNSRSVNM
jgi:raffinose/stachyose/melibiose transport system permease protein